MKWPWVLRRNAATRLSWLQIRMAQVEARLVECRQQREEAMARWEAERKATSTLVDNALFAAGASPIFEPEAARFRPRPVAEQQAEAARGDRPLTLAEWRRRLEANDRLAAQRERKTQLDEELKRIVTERKAEQHGHR